MRIIRNNDIEYDDSYPIIRTSGNISFRFDANHPYNHLKAGQWIPSQKYTGGRAHGGVVLTSIIMFFMFVIPAIFLSSLLMIILPAIIVAFMPLLIIIVYIWLVIHNLKHRRNKYNLKKSVIAQPLLLMQSCGIQRNMMTCRLERSNNDTFEKLDGDYAENQPIRVFSYNPNENPNTRKWYLAFTQLKHLNMYVDTVVFIETAGDKARLLVPDNPMIGNIIAVQALGIKNHDMRIRYEDGIAYFADTYNDMDANGISDNKEKQNSNSFMFDNTQTHDATMFTM